MDAMPLNMVPELATWRQRTLKAPIGCVGVGLHSGLRVNMTLRPARADHGVVFRRTDLGIEIPARFDHVVDTRLATVLGLDDGTARIGTVEHLMAALAGSLIDNVMVEVDGPELPILDGSAAPYQFLLDCAGSVEQEAPRTVIHVNRRVHVSEGDAFAEFRPASPGRTHLHMAMSIDFSAAAIGRQALSLELTPE